MDLSQHPNLPTQPRAFSLTIFKGLFVWSLQNASEWKAALEVPVLLSGMACRNSVTQGVSKTGAATHQRSKIFFQGLQRGIVWEVWNIWNTSKQHPIVSLYFLKESLKPTSKAIIMECWLRHLLYLHGSLGALPLKQMPCTWERSF